MLHSSTETLRITVLAQVHDISAVHLLHMVELQMVSCMYPNQWNSFCGAELNVTCLNVPCKHYPQLEKGDTAIAGDFVYVT